MKIKREDLGKLINILQELYNKGDKIIDISNSFNIPKYKKDFIVPDNWYLKPTEHGHYWIILQDWLITTDDVKKGHPKGKGWETKFSGDYTLCYSKWGKHFAGTNTRLDDSYIEITWEQFEEYIYNKK